MIRDGIKVGRLKRSGILSLGVVVVLLLMIGLRLWGLQAQSLNIGSVPIGAFQDEDVRRLIGDEVEPFYIITVGKIS